MRLKSVLQREVYPEGQLLNWVREHKGLNLAFCAIGLLVAGVSVFFLKPITISLLVISGLISLAYVSRVFSWKGEKRELREISIIKTILVAMVWSIVSVVLVWLEIGTGSDLNWVLLVSFFLIILGLTIPFDIRDIPYDREMGLKTIAMSAGLQRAKIAATLSVVTGIALVLMLVLSNFFGLLAILLCVWLVIALILLWMTNENRSELWYTGLLDGLIILFSLIVIYFH